MREACDDTPDAVVDTASGPERKCILSGRHGPRAGLIRLALGPDGAVWPDLGARLPGRGAWIAPDRAMLEEAMAKGRLKGALARAFKGPATVPDDLAARIGEGLKRRALDRLGLEHRAGHLILGSDRIAEWARAGRLFLLLHADDAADDGSGKLDQAFRVGGGDMAQVIWVPAGRDSLSRALGRENMVHSGVSDGKAAARIAADLLRWRAFLGLDAGKTAFGDEVLDDDVSGVGGLTAGRRNDEGRE